jgi:deoxyribodipyrimidine photo-lyase
MSRAFAGIFCASPGEITTKSKDPYKVYTSFWRACSLWPIEPPAPAPRLSIDLREHRRDRLDDWQLLPKRPNWVAGWEKLWTPGEAGAIKRLDSFVDTGLVDYQSFRDRPDRPNVSRLSPHLHFGEISVRQIWARMSIEAEEVPKRRGVDKFRSELGWREFAYHLLFHFRSLPERNWRQSFDAYPWRDDEVALKAWQQGRTGYPLVDAGMRELWQTGWMHNRARMIAASFLTKQLRIDWRRGEAWFWDTLVDADLANNSASWQWVAGSGADAAPYFRIFNPVLQARKFDPAGDYIRHWCPELANLPNTILHAPFEADEQTLAAAGVRLGENYPRPIIDLDSARLAALEGYKRVRERTMSTAQVDTDFA